MDLIKNYFNQKNFIFSIVLILPFLYISGSLLLNLSLIIVIILAILLSEKNYFKNFFLNHKIYFLLAFALIFLNILNSETKLYSSSKLIAYSRFIFFSISYIFVISKLSNEQIIKISKIFLLLIIFVIFDSLIQLFFGKDIFGFPYFYPYNSITGPLGDEMIVGFYLLNFGILSISFLNYFNLIKKNSNLYLILVLALIILLTGERSAFFTFFLFLFFLFIISKQKRLVFIISLSIVVSSLIVINSFSFLNNKYPFKTIINQSFLIEDNSKQEKTLDLLITNTNQNIPINKWLGHFERANEIIDKNKFFGSGFRNYRIVCFDYQKKYFNRKNISKCSTHPHNFHLEILSDNGILGYLMFIFFIIYLISTFIKGKHFENFGICLIFSLILAFIFPLKTTGSIFTTNYAFVFWYLIANYFFLINKTKEN